ncbi:hypothetical protein G432_20615 (plasmid) [Sphingomonas sp. MM-1]|uniref:hypothetical protein n=1 Tax=Sphingomonas sp. MM-1 TaxID=745310 RepID=UPI0002C073AD|nr:hypothetical protein [Sphingomonas sp. MM-1]AGH51805.1 hypothetical protein G432_20615 [Sphingomonas sp. MM-1]
MTSSILDMSRILDLLASQSRRPRYTFMVLNLISEAADASGKVGPYVVQGDQPLPVRDWLCDALATMAQRDPRRRRLEAEVMSQLESMLPTDEQLALPLIRNAVRERIRASNRPNISRAVSDLVRTGLLKRHYQGWRTDHHNRGAGRQAVYTVHQEALAALRRRSQLF